MGDRVLAKVGKNKWHAGVVRKVTSKGVDVEFDDGFEALVEPDDFKDLKIFTGGARRIYQALNDVQATALLNLGAQRLNTSVTVKPKLVFLPTSADLSYAKTFNGLKRWLETVAAHYKLADSTLLIESKFGSVGCERSFAEVSTTRAKYERVVQELTASFAQSPNWRRQAFAGGMQFFSNNGLFHASFYDIPNAMHSTGRRQIGFYIRTSVPRRGKN